MKIAAIRARAYWIGVPRQQAVGCAGNGTNRQLYQPIIGKTDDLTQHAYIRCVISNFLQVYHLVGPRWFSRFWVGVSNQP